MSDFECPACHGSGRIRPTREQREEMLDLMLATIYSAEGVEVWRAHAESRGWTLDEQLMRAEQLATGAVG